MAAYGDRRTKIVSYDRGPIDLQNTEQLDQIAYSMESRIAMRVLCRCTSPVASHVHRNRPVSLRGNCLHLTAPTNPQVREAMAEEHRSSLTQFDDM